MAVQADPLTHFFCGSVSGVFTCTLVQPLDVIKTNLLTFGSKSTIRKSCKFVNNQYGPLGFWKGLSPAVLRAMIGGGINFSLLERLKIWIPKDKTLMGHIMHDTLSGMSARAFTTVLLSPLSVIKIRMEAPQANMYKGIGDAMHQIYRDEGMKGFYKGFKPTLLRDLPYSGMAYMFYRQYHHGFKGVISETYLSMVSGGLAGLTATLITHPFDIIKTRNQFNFIGKTEKFEYDGIIHAFRTIYKHEGLQGFTTGLSIRLIERTVAFATIWFIYENLKNHFKPKDKNRKIDEFR